MSSVSGTHAQPSPPIRGSTNVERTSLLGRPRRDLTCCERCSSAGAHAFIWLLATGTVTAMAFSAKAYHKATTSENELTPHAPGIFLAVLLTSFFSFVTVGAACCFTCNEIIEREQNAG